MIHHMIARPGANDGLRFEYDFNELKTTITRLSVANDGSIRLTDPTVVDGLLRHCAATSDAWYAAEMAVRKFGEPAWVRRYDWETLEKLDEIRVPHERVGLMSMGVSADGARALVDRVFDDPKESVNNTAVVIDLNSGEVTAHCRPFNTNLDSPIFDATNSRVAMIHTDQGGAEARLYKVSGDPPELLGEFAQHQISDDFSTGALAFVPGGIAVWTTQVWDFAGEFAVYSEDTFETFFEPVKLGGLSGEEEDPDLEMHCSNTDFTFVVEADYAWVGGAGKIHRINLKDGEIDTTELNAEGAVMRVVRFGNHLVASTHFGELEAVALS